MPSLDEESTPMVSMTWVGEQELRELRFVLDRAMNTWEPQDWPGWLDKFSLRVDTELAA